MDDRLRDFFDRHLETVLAGLPQWVRALLDDVPLHVEDYPAPEMMDELGVRRRDDLCGLYTGIPLTHRHVEDGGRMPDVVTIYREGIMRQSAGPDGQLREKELLRQIRITVLHELGHHHGLTEDDLEGLGYG